MRALLDERTIFCHRQPGLSLLVDLGLLLAALYLLFSLVMSAWGWLMHTPQTHEAAQQAPHMASQAPAPPTPEDTATQTAESAAAHTARPPIPARTADALARIRALAAEGQPEAAEAGLRELASSISVWLLHLELSERNKVVEEVALAYEAQQKPEAADALRQWHATSVTDLLNRARNPDSTAP